MRSFIAHAVTCRIPAVGTHFQGTKEEMMQLEVNLGEEAIQHGMNRLPLSGNHLCEVAPGIAHFSWKEPINLSQCYYSAVYYALVIHHLPFFGCSNVNCHNCYGSMPERRNYHLSGAVGHAM